MSKLTIFIFLIFYSHLICGQTKKIETEHFNAKYEVETEEYVRASLKVLELAWNIATRNGWNLPDKIKFTVIKTDKSVLYFDC